MLSAPFSMPQAIFPRVFGVDWSEHRSGKLDSCVDYKGRPFPHCYGGHPGTDFALSEHFHGMNMGSVNVIAAAPGRVVDMGIGNPDRCFMRPGTLPGTSSNKAVICPDAPLPGGGEVDPGTHANYITILQDDGRLALYYHLKRESEAVSVGDRLECGQLLAKIGSSGISSSPHLHFQIKSLMDGGSNRALKPRTQWEIKELSPCDFSVENVDPYKEGLWRKVSAPLVPLLDSVQGIPDNVCPHPSTDDTYELGDRCGDYGKCGVGKTCDGYICRVLNVLPDDACDDNRLCGRDHSCVEGRCKAGCICSLFDGCFLDENKECKKEISTKTVREDCESLLGGFCAPPCFVDGNSVCKFDRVIMDRQSCPRRCQ